VSHTIKIDDALWDAYDGSPMKMRDTLWAVVLPEAQQDADDVAFEKVITLKFDTRCSVCRTELAEGTKARYQILADDSRKILCQAHD
jgi:hypothetical protein